MKHRHILIQWAMGLVVAALLGEAYLRLVAATPLWQFLPIISPQALRPSPVAEVDYLPGARLLNLRENRAWTYIDADGLPGASLPPRPADRPVVAVLGNSMAAGEQVAEADRFPARLAGALERRGATVATVSLAMPGASPIRMLARLEEKAPALRPAFVVGVFPVADLMGGRTVAATEWIRLQPDAAGEMRLVSSAAASYQAQEASLAYRVKSWLKIHVRLYKMLADFRDAAQFGTGSRAAGGAAGCTGMWRDVSRAAGEDDTSSAWRVLRGIGRAYHTQFERMDLRGHLALYAYDHPSPACVEAVGGNERLSQVLARIKSTLASERVSVSFLEDDITTDLPALYGFGMKMGFGHLNEGGHTVWAEALAHQLATHSGLTRP